MAKRKKSGPFAPPRIARPGKALSEQRLAAVEREHGFAFPAAYRAFLLAHNGGTPDPNGFAMKGKKTVSEVCTHFLGIDTGRSYDCLLATLEVLKDAEEPRLPRRLIPIADDPFGNLICISVEGNDAGRIYFWDHEQELSQEQTKDGDVDDAAISLVADSFDAFLNQFEAEREEKPAKPSKAGAPRPWWKLIAAGDVEGVRAWLDGGGRIDVSDATHGDPLSLSVIEEQPEVFELLLDRGADPAQALKWAIEQQAWDLVRIVLDRNAGRKLAIEAFYFQEVLSDAPDVRIVEQIIDAGARVDVPLQRGGSLYHATEDRADPAIVRLLLERGAPVGQFGHAGRSALVNAICVGSLEVCKMLIDAGENLYAEPPHKKGLSEQMIEQELKKKRPDMDFVKWQQSIVEHNRERPAAWYLSNVPKGKKIAKQLIAYAASKGQSPPATPGAART